MIMDYCMQQQQIFNNNDDDNNNNNNKMALFFGITFCPLYFIRAGDIILEGYPASANLKR